MNDEAKHGVGHNNPPDPIGDALAPYSDAIAESENWCDGEPVKNEDQLKIVDQLTKDVKAALRDVLAAEKSETAPLQDAKTAIHDRYRPTKGDLADMRDALIKTGATFKAKLAAEKAEIKRKAYEKQREAELEAQKKADAAAANEGDLQAKRDAAQANRDLIDAKQTASTANKDKVLGRRTVHKHEVEDLRALVNWIAKNDKPAMSEFAHAYAAKNHRSGPIDGVHSWSDKESF